MRKAGCAAPVSHREYGLGSSGWRSGYGLGHEIAEPNHKKRFLRLLTSGNAAACLAEGQIRG